MEMGKWLFYFGLTFTGWWLLLYRLQRFANYFEGKVIWGKDFRTDFFKILLVTFFRATPENHLNRLEKRLLPKRLCLLALGLRSFALAFIFIMVFFVWGLLPFWETAVFYFILLCLSIWKKNWRNLSRFLLALTVFLYGFHHLLQASSHLISNGEAASWVYELGNNYFEGALIGLAIGAFLRLITRTSGVSWWMGMNLLVAGILSLGGAWGFFLGDFLVGAIEDLIRHREKEFRWRNLMALAVGVVMFLLSGPFQVLIMNWMNGQYSVELRAFQFGVMVFLFLTLESIIALGFFHFYYFRQKND